jgi:hypothetical protein
VLPLAGELLPFGESLSVQAVDRNGRGFSEKDSLSRVKPPEAALRALDNESFSELGSTVAIDGQLCAGGAEPEIETRRPLVSTKLSTYF